MRNNQLGILASIAAAILAASRQRGVTINEWYLSDTDYDAFSAASKNLCGYNTMKICGASIHRSSSVPDLPRSTSQVASIR